MTAVSISRRYHLSSRSIGRDWLFGFPTLTVNRYSPEVEQIYLPSASSVEGDLTIELDLKNSTISHSQVLPRLSKLKLSVSKESQHLSSDQIGLDLRLNSPQNWAHAVTNHLPVALLVKRLLADVDRAIVVIFPADVSNKILEIFRLSGFICLATHAPVSGYICNFSLKPWVSIRGERCDIVGDGLQGTELVKKLAASGAHEDRIFLSRRKTRTITNEKEVIEHLANLGFKTLYIEDYSPVEQIAYIANAREIVAVHGASMGPMIFRNAYAATQTYKLIELFSPAHVTGAWRSIAWQQGAKWAGVRGRLWPELVKDGADFVSNMSNFEVSLDSLQSALSYLEVI